jgi:DNA modification methylase
MEGVRSIMKVLDQQISEKYSLYNGDSCEVVKGIPDNSIHYTIFSPPFASLYTYSNSDRDMGNSKGDDEFYKHFVFLAKELYRITMPGRLLSFHCMDLPLMKERDGIIGLKDFPAIIRQVFEDCGFVYHSRVTIWKNPVTEMQRTKALGLLWKQIKKDSSMNRQGIPDYIITMRKPGDNPERIAHTDETFPCDVWQKYASPVWMDIKQSDTLQRKSAREEKDERHICPLQLEVIRRCIDLWTNPGDIVFDPFLGIGSTPYVALQMGRRGIGCELKQSYYKQAVKNLEHIAGEEIEYGIVGQMDIFDFI